MDKIVYTPEELRNLAGTELANYDGSELPIAFEGNEFEGNEFGGYEYPMGFGGDDLISLDGAQPGYFNPAVDGLRQFSFTLTNSGLNTTVYLWPGPTNLAGTITDGTFTSIGGVNCTGVSNSDETIAVFLAWIKQNPTQLLAIKANSSTAGQATQAVNYSMVSPFRREPGRTLRLSNAQDQGTLTTTIAAVETPDVYACSDSRAIYTLLANSTTQIDLFFGPTANLSAALERKAKAGAIRQMPGRLPSVGGRANRPVMMPQPGRKGLPAKRNY